MKTGTSLALSLLAATAAFACGPKADTANPGDLSGCTKEAMVCEDGSTVSREGPSCEFAACPDEAEPAAADGDDDDDAPDDEADAE